MIRYTDPASVEKIMDLIGGTKGVLNSPDGLYIFRDGCPKVKKGWWVDLVDGRVRVYTTDREAAEASVMDVRGYEAPLFESYVKWTLERMKTNDEI